MPGRIFEAVTFICPLAAKEAEVAVRIAVGLCAADPQSVCVLFV